MTMNPALIVKNPPPAVWRWSVLVAISVAMFGNYYVYDSIAPVADSLQRLLGYTDTQIGTLNAIYSLPNIIVVLIGGVIVDRFGTRLSTLLFAIICSIGALVTALSPAFPVMAAGRLIFGLGAESMIVAITVAIGQWFVGRQLGFAFGVNLSIARAGSYSADYSTTWFKPLYDQGWQPPLFLAFGFSLIAIVACIVYYLMDRRVARNFDVPQASPSDRFVWSDLWRFDRSFWYVIGLCVTFYSVIFPFRSTFAIKYFQHAHGVTLQEAGALNGYVFLAAIIATPALRADGRSARPSSRVHGLRMFPARGGVSDSRLHQRQPLDHDGDDRYCVFAGPGHHLAGGALSGRTQTSRHGLRADDDGAGDGPDGDQSARRRAERLLRRERDQPSGLHADAVAVPLPEPVRFRVCVCAQSARDEPAGPRPRSNQGRSARIESDAPVAPTLPFPFELLIAFHGVDDEAGDGASGVFAKDHRRA
jgi:MFS family permease